MIFVRVGFEFFRFCLEFPVKTREARSNFKKRTQRRSGLDGIFYWPSWFGPAILFDRPTWEGEGSRERRGVGKQREEATSYRPLFSLPLPSPIHNGRWREAPDQHELCTNPRTDCRGPRTRPPDSGTNVRGLRTHLGELAI